MERTISATELARNLSDVLNRVQYRGERFMIQRNGAAVASLAPALPPRAISLRVLAAQLGDLSLPGEGFAEDLEALQVAAPEPLPPWPS